MKRINLSSQISSQLLCLQIRQQPQCNTGFCFFNEQFILLEPTPLLKKYFSSFFIQINTAFF